MSDPVGARGEVEAALELAAREAAAYLKNIDAAYVLKPGSEEAVRSWRSPAPGGRRGDALRRRRAREPRAGGCDSLERPAVLSLRHGRRHAGRACRRLADVDARPSAYTWASSPLASALEQVAVDWLRQLFELPETFGGVLVTGGTMANFTGLAAARHWWAERQGADVEDAGLSELPAPVVLTSGYVHSTAVLALGMLGLGRGNAQILARHGTGRLDVDGLRDRLDALDVPAILIANAGEVNAGGFDPISELADLAEEHGAWLHVDGAFGLFARVAPGASLHAGLERAHSIASDGHKWLNVPYDCGFTFVREPARLVRALNVGAPYLPRPTTRTRTSASCRPRARRARALAVWATLYAYGRAGHREMVERHLALAQHLARRVDAERELERLAEVPLNIVCFRAKPSGAPEEELDDLNRELGAALLEDGRLRWHHGLRRQGRVPAGDRELAHRGARCRSPRRGAPRADPRARLELSNHPGRIAGDDHRGRDVAGHDASHPDDGVVADRYTRPDDRAASDPDVALDRDRPGESRRCRRSSGSVGWVAA